MWSCDTEAVAHVTSTGLVTSVAEGKSQVVASDKKNAAHFDKAEVHVQANTGYRCTRACSLHNIIAQIELWFIDFIVYSFYATCGYCLSN